MVKNDLFPVRAYFCPFCRKIFKRRRHLCSKDPRNKSCGSCTNIGEFDGIWYCKEFDCNLEDLVEETNQDYEVYRGRIINCKKYNCYELYENRFKEYLSKGELNGKE